MMNERVILNQYGEALLIPEGKNELDNLWREEKKGSKNIIGIHETCSCKIWRIPVSPTHYAIVCEDCYLRIIVPVTVRNYKQLRLYFKKLIQKALHGPSAYNFSFSDPPMTPVLSAPDLDLRDKEIIRLKPDPAEQKAATLKALERIKQRRDQLSESTITPSLGTPQVVSDFLKRFPGIPPEEEPKK